MAFRRGNAALEGREGLLCGQRYLWFARTRIRFWKFAGEQQPEAEAKAAERTSDETRRTVLRLPTLLG